MKLTQASKSEKSKKGIIEVDVDFKLLGGKKLLSLNTTALQIKQTAATVLLEIGKSMNKSFFKYVEKA